MDVRKGDRMTLSGVESYQVLSNQGRVVQLSEQKMLPKKGD